MRGHWLYTYEKTVDASSLQAKLIIGFTHMAQPDGMIYIQNGTNGHAIVDIYSGSITVMPLSPQGTNAYRGGLSATEAPVFYNRANGRWTFLSFNSLTKVLYANTNWGGMITIGTVNINTQILEIAGVPIMSAKGDFPMIVNCWLDETTFGFMHEDGSPCFLNLISFSISRIGPSLGVALGGPVAHWIASYDGYVHAMMDTAPVNTEYNKPFSYPAGPAYPANATSGTLPNSYGGLIWGGIGNYNVDTWNVLTPNYACQITIGATVTAPNGPISPDNPMVGPTDVSNIWDMGNYLWGGAYINYVRNYVNKSGIKFMVAYHGQVALAMSQNGGGFVWDIYLPKPAPRLELVKFPRLTNFSRPISPIGAWEA